MDGLDHNDILIFLNGDSAWGRVGYSWSVEGSGHTKFLQSALEFGGKHRIAVVGVEDQLLLTAPTDSLEKAGPAHKISCNGWVFSFGDVPATILRFHTSITKSMWSQIPRTVVGR
jgi:hypothetical protein